jgi:hypothetical protein
VPDLEPCLPRCGAATCGAVDCQEDPARVRPNTFVVAGQPPLRCQDHDKIAERVDVLAECGGCSLRPHLATHPAAAVERGMSPPVTPTSKIAESATFHAVWPFKCMKT